MTWYEMACLAIKGKERRGEKVEADL